MFLFITLAAAMAQPSYPDAVYPTARTPAVRRTEVPFAETEASRRIGFDQPFPAKPRRLLRVDDFGAKADGVTDCTPAVYSALKAARAGGAAEVVFAARGRYYLAPHPELGSDDLAIISAAGLADTVIRGQGHDTVLVAGDPKLGCLMLRDSETVMVRDLAIDYNPLPFTQGTVAEVRADEGAFVLRLHAGYPTPAALAAAVPGQHAGYVMAKAAGCQWPAIGGLFITKTSQVDGDLWRFEADAKALRGYLAVGDDFVYVGRRIAQQALSASFVRGLWVQDVTVHASPTCGFGLSNVDGASIDGYADVPPTGSDRRLSSNADGLFVHGERGGITVRNSRFMGQGDDCINLHCPGLPASAVRVLAGAEIEIRAALDLRAADLLEIVNTKTTTLKGRVAVQRVAERRPEDTTTRCTLAQPLDAVGYDPATDEIYPVNLSASNFKVINNHFGQNRSRCLLIQARDGLIAGNTGENAEGYGVILSYGSTAWHEGVVPANVTIEGNLFRNLTNRGMAATIEAFGGPARLLTGLTVRGNRFENSRKMVLAAAGVDGLTFTGNRAGTASGRRQTWNHPEWYPVDCSLYLVNCARVLVDDYHLVDPGLRDAGIYLDKACAPGPAGVTLRGLSLDLAAGVPPVKDAR